MLMSTSMAIVSAEERFCCGRAAEEWANAQAKSLLRSPTQPAASKGHGLLKTIPSGSTRCSSDTTTSPHSLAVVIHNGCLLDAAAGL